MRVISLIPFLLPLALAVPMPQNQGIQAQPAGPSGALAKLEGQVQTVLQHGIEITSKSWELGALFQARLELNAPHLAPYLWNAGAGAPPADILQSAVDMLRAYDFSPVTENSANINDYLGPNPPTPLRPGPLVNGDGALGDPASVGVAAWILAMYGDQIQGAAPKNAYAWAAANQLAYIRQGASNGQGCISQRENTYELWSDMGYMISPFIAFLGLATDSVDLLNEALGQWLCVAEQLLRDSMFIHITGQDETAWATGNGWMLMGLGRVLSSIDSANIIRDQAMQNNIARAESIAAEVFGKLFSTLDVGDGRIPNRVNVENVGESAGTAGVAAAYYRLLKRNPTAVQSLLGPAGRAFDSVANLVTPEGWLPGCVDPTGYGITPESSNFRMGPWDLQSPEGQSFTVLMYAARKASETYSDPPAKVSPDSGGGTNLIEDSNSNSQSVNKETTTEQPEKLVVESSGSPSSPIINQPPVTQQPQQPAATGKPLRKCRK